MKRNHHILLLLFTISLFLGLQMQAQKRVTHVQYQGKVLDEKGNPVPSAKIYFENGKKITHSGSDGSFQIDLGMTDVVIIEASYFEPVTIKSDSLADLDRVTLQKNDYGLKSD